MSFVCLTSHSETAIVYTTVCKQEGDWEPHPIDMCQLGMHNIYIKIHLLIIPTNVILWLQQIKLC